MFLRPAFPKPATPAPTDLVAEETSAA
jgi:hypothetical protein